MLEFAHQNEQALLKYLNYLGNRDAVLSYHQIQGVLYAMACSPEPIRPSEWFELIWLSDDPCFDDAGEAKAFYQLLVELFRHIGDQAQRDLYRPGTDSDGHFSLPALTHWCEGFLMGHQYLENIWLLALDELKDDSLYDRVESALDWVVAFIESEGASWSVEEGDRVMSLQLQLQQLLTGYQTVHRLWRKDARTFNAQPRLENLYAVDRDQPCPCGSGRLFGQCCLH